MLRCLSTSWLLGCEETNVHFEQRRRNEAKILGLSHNSMNEESIHAR